MSMAFSNIMSKYLHITAWHNKPSGIWEENFPQDFPKTNFIFLNHSTLPLLLTNKCQ